MSFITPLRLFIAGAILITGAFTASVALAPVEEGTEAALFLKPIELVAEVNTPIKLEILISANTPINAFSGDVVFDTNLFTVEHIEYNTNLADLWVTEPWYSKADNTIYFAGGTTGSGGFIGTDNLITVYLTSKSTGRTTVSIKNGQVLKHDGLGTDTILADSIDSVISFMKSEKSDLTKNTTDTKTSVTITPTAPQFDINNDGKISFADMAIFMLKIGTSDSRFDFNKDGTVSTIDLSLLLNASKTNN